MHARMIKRVTVYGRAGMPLLAITVHADLVLITRNPRQINFFNGQSKDETKAFSTFT